MTIDDFIVNYDSFKSEFQLEKLKKIFDHLLDDIAWNEPLIMDVLGVLNAAEAEDYFGTEGFKL